MKKTRQGKIRAFLASEEGRVSAKAPLTLGVATGSLLLAQVVLTPSVQSHAECFPGGCPPGEVCAIWCGRWDLGTCVEVHSECVEPPH